MTKLITNRAIRRTLGGTCLVVGALLLWLAPNAVVVGLVLFVAGIGLEAAGIALEPHDRRR